MSDVHYVFENGKTFAIHEGKVIAASTDSDDVERQVKLAFGGPDPSVHGEPPMHGGGPTEMPRPPEMDSGHPGEDACPECGAPIDPQTGLCIGCGMDAHGPLGQGMGNMYPHDEPSPGFEMGGEAGPYMAKVVTPNGVKGTVLGKVAGLWGDEVTIRLENGRIVKLPVGTELNTEKTAARKVTNPIERLEKRLAHVPDGTRESLETRLPVLTNLQYEASTLIREGASHADSIRLDQIVVTADAEAAEVKEALAHLDDVESYQPPTFSIRAADEAAGISREDASWLDHTLDEMIAEAEATDFQKLMDEGPEAFTAELPDVALADTGVAHQMASSFISEKTAGIDRKIANPYMETFLARVEECRRNELSNRKQTTHKEAAAEEDKYKDLPDESIFL